MRTTIRLGLAALLAALATVTAAHERGDRAMGTVERVSAKEIVVKDTDGHSVAFAITPGTRFLRGEQPVRREDVRVGERAVVQGELEGERAVAVRVRLAAAAR